MKNTEKGLSIATEILNQLGGRRFLAMTGSHKLVAIKNVLGMKLRRNSSKANHLRITLTPMDVYTMEFLSVRGPNFKTVATFENVYSDQLQSIFTDTTGLYTNL